MQHRPKPRRFSALFHSSLALLVVPAILASAQESASRDAPRQKLADLLDSSWVDNEAWYDGTAEINLYDATLVKYGEPRQADELVHIFVTESHDPDLLVKADDWRRPGLVPMMKLNYVLSVRTGVYRYEQMLSFFFDRRDLHVAKMTLSSHEWCGNTFKELVNFGERASYDFNTYWDGQGNGSFEVDFPDDLVLYESLPGQLRALRFAEGLEASFPLLPSQLSSQVQAPSWREARLGVVRRERVKVPAGDFEGWILQLKHAGGKDELAFEAAFPHRLLFWRQASGDSFRLKRSERMAYWGKAGVGNEDLLRD
ncbi:MAG: hypothetical protein MPN21_22245 [Thermoanaerobaculia bacterium]|nr:hypothetical protein [Thermoanaerobaculia bacterium]